MKNEYWSNCYVLRVYDVGCDTPPCVPFGEDTITPIAIHLGYTKDYVIEQWRKLFKDYEGFAYTLFKGEQCIISGALDSNDMYVLEDLEEVF